MKPRAFVPNWFSVPSTQRTRSLPSSPIISEWQYDPGSACESSEGTSAGAMSAVSLPATEYLCCESRNVLNECVTYKCAGRSSALCWHPPLREIISRFRVDEISVLKALLAIRKECQFEGRLGPRGKCTANFSCYAIYRVVNNSICQGSRKLFMSMRREYSASCPLRSTHTKLGHGLGLCVETEYIYSMSLGSNAKVYGTCDSCYIIRCPDHLSR